MDMEAISYLLKEHEGELLIHEDDNYSLKVKYSSGALPMFSKLEIFILDKTKFSVVDGKVKINCEELQESFEAHQFRGFFPLLELILTSDNVSSDALEEAKKNVTNGLYSFIRLKNGKVETLIVSVGNSEKHGVFYCPDSSSQEELVPLVELKENGIRIYKENFAKVSEL